MSTLLPGYLTVSEAAAIINLSPASIARYARIGRLPSVRIGTNYLIPKAAAKAFKPNPVGNPLFPTDQNPRKLLALQK